MELATQQAILTEIVKGENGKMLKTDLSPEKITELQGYVGQSLDCRFDFTRTEGEEEVTEEMACGICGGKYILSGRTGYARKL